MEALGTQYDRMEESYSEFMVNPINIPEIVSHIFTFLNTNDLLASRLTCRDWKEIASQNYLWRLLFAKTFALDKDYKTNKHTFRTYLKCSFIDKIIRLKEYKPKIIRMDNNFGKVNDFIIKKNVIIGASNTGFLHFWDNHSGKKLHSINAHHHSISHIKVFENCLVSSSYDKTLKLWDLKSCELLKTCEGHIGIVGALKKSSQGIVSGSWDSTVRLWHFETGQELKKFDTFGAIKTLKVFQNKIISGSWNGYIQIIDIEKSTSLNLEKKHRCNIYCLKIFDLKLFSVSLDKFCVWDLNSGTFLKKIQINSRIYSLYFWDGKIYAGCFDGSIWIWDLATAQLLKRWQAHSKTIWHLKGYHNFLISATNSIIKIWDLINFKELKRIKYANGFINLKMKKGKLAFSSQSGKFHLLDFTHPRVIRNSSEAKKPSRKKRRLK